MRRPRAPLPERLDHQQFPVSVGSAKWTQRCSHWKVGPDLVDQIQGVSHTDIKVKGVSQEERVSAEERERVTEEKTETTVCKHETIKERVETYSVYGGCLYLPPTKQEIQQRNG